MRFFENKRIAVIGMIALILLSAPLGAARSLSPLRRAAEQVFYAGADGDGLGIQNDLNKRVELAYNLVTVARRYTSGDTDEINAVLNAREEMTVTDSIKDKCRANTKLTEATGDLIEALGKFSLSETDARYRSSIAADLKSRNEIISHDAYNAGAQAFNEKLAAFPASVFGRLAGLRPLELFT